MPDVTKRICTESTTLGADTTFVGPRKRVLQNLDEFGLVARVLRDYGDCIKFQTDSGRLVTWNGQRFGDFPHIAGQLVKDVIAKIVAEFHDGDLHVDEHGEVVEREDLLQFQKRSSSYGVVQKILKALQLAPRAHVKSADFDADNYLINLENGVLDLRSGVLITHIPTQLHMKLAPVKWVAEAKCPAWEEFVQEITCGDRELAAYLQRLVGYCLSGSTQEEVLPILHGSGANGKSVFLSRVRKLLGSGEYAITLGTGSILSSSFHGIRCDLRQLEGARVALAIEANKGSRLDEAVLKALTGGDEISARAMRENPVQFTPHAKILMAVNHLPGFEGNDRGIRRRLQVVPFKHEFDGRVRKEEVDRKLDAEAEGILAWAVVGFQEWRKQGLNPPEAVVQATLAYFEASDNIGEFLRERTSRGAGYKTPLRSLYGDYADWTKDACVDCVGPHRFTELLLERGHTQGRDRNCRFWQDLAIRLLND
ncbi:MAG: phage/plasmid primase, P4 family [Desulfovibrio sp.]